jgi:hypothetical protein
MADLADRNHYGYLTGGCSEYQVEIDYVSALEYQLASIWPGVTVTAACEVCLFQCKLRKQWLEPPMENIHGGEQPEFFHPAQLRWCELE